MIQITITGKTAEELSAQAANVIAMLGGTSAKAVEVLSASEQSRLRGDATVVPPKDNKPSAADKKKADAAAKKKAEEEAAAAAAAAEAEALGETDDTVEDDSAEEALTNEDVKKLLIEVRTAYPKEATIISQIVQEYGKAKKISEVADENLPAVAAHCRELLKKAKK